MSVATHDCFCGMCYDCMDYQEEMWKGLAEEIRQEEVEADKFVRSFYEAEEKARTEEYDNRVEILVCYDQGVIETDTYEWECFEGKYADKQTPMGHQLSLWDLKGPIGG